VHYPMSALKCTIQWRSRVSSTGDGWCGGGGAGAGFGRRALKVRAH
jgi:hypothetical protein